MSDPALLSLTEVAAQIRERKLSSVEVTQALLARIQHWQPKLNAFVRIEADEALARAKEADAELARSGPKGVLHGVPLAHKDMYYRAGTVATCGSKIRRDFVPDHTATALTRLDTAGAISLGTLHMAEFAFGPTGHNHHFGPPWECKRSRLQLFVSRFPRGEHVAKRTPEAGDRYECREERHICLYRNQDLFDAAGRTIDGFDFTGRRR